VSKDKNADKQYFKSFMKNSVFYKLEQLAINWKNNGNDTKEKEVEFFGRF